MEELRLIKKIPISLRNPFWSSLIDSVDIELQNIKEQVEFKKTLYDLTTMDYDRLIEISDLLGVLFDASINDTIEFLRREVAAIPFKIKYKSTARLYLSFFRSLNRIGDMYIYYFKASSDALVRNSEDFLVDAVGHDFTLPYFHPSSKNFSGFVEDALKLDTGLQLDVENEGDIWTLDTVDSQVSTNHLALEYFIDRIITKQVRNESDLLIDKDFLMTWEYMDFIQVNTDFSRRVKEVPHIGAQLSVLTDESGTVNPLDAEFSTPSLEIKTCVTDNYFDIESVLDLSYIEFGIGAFSNLPTKEALPGEIQPTMLKTRVARNFILFDEKYENEDYIGGITEYRGQQINRFSLHDETGYLLDDTFGLGEVDGYNSYFRGSLLFAPVQKGNIRIIFQYMGIEREVFDDRKGTLVGDNATGTIDYNTGRYTIETDFLFQENAAPFIGDGSTTEFEYAAIIPNPIETSYTFDPTDNHVWIKYSVRNKIFLGRDDGFGNIVDISPDGAIETATVDYTTGEFYFLFSEPLTEDYEVSLTYKYRKISIPDANTEIRADYYFTVQNIEITEAGLYDINDKLIAYSTFPPVEFNSSKNHLNLGFLIKKGLLT